MATQPAPPPSFLLYLELSSQLMLVFILTAGAQLKTGDGRELTRTSPSFTLQEEACFYHHGHTQGLQASYVPK